MEPQNHKKARASNETQSVIRAVGGDGAVQVRAGAKPSVLTLQVARQAGRESVELYAGSALKLAEDLVRLARRALLVEAKEAA